MDELKEHSAKVEVSAYGPVQRRALILWTKSDLSMQVSGTRKHQEDLLFRGLGHVVGFAGSVCKASTTCSMAPPSTRNHLPRALPIALRWACSCSIAALCKIVHSTMCLMTLRGWWKLHPRLLENADSRMARWCGHSDLLNVRKSLLIDL